MKLLNGFNDNARRFPAKNGMPKPGWITSGRGTTPAMGRFTSPDPLMASANIYNPQSWNRYSYTLNNPLKFIDPLGLAYAPPAYNCTKGNKACLNDEQRRILENASEDLSGEEYWGTLTTEEQISFVNATDGLGSIVFDDGTTALSHIESVSIVKPDRIYTNVDSSFYDKVKGSDNFKPANGSLHGEYRDSFKSKNGYRGNIQISFAGKNRAEIDHDLFNKPILHFFGEVIPNHAAKAINKIFGTNIPETTNQDDVRRMLMADPKVGITPSPDPKFNRRN
jgi:RHS repeat-associated protein